MTVEAGPVLVLLVRDNGTGIKETGRRSGLANLADRAALLGGTMAPGLPKAAGPNSNGGCRCRVLAGEASAALGEGPPMRI